MPGRVGVGENEGEIFGMENPEGRIFCKKTLPSGNIRNDMITGSGTWRRGQNTRIGISAGAFNKSSISLSSLTMVREKPAISSEVL